MCAIIASILEQCSLLLPLLWGAGPMALMLWLDGMMMMMMMMTSYAYPTNSCECCKTSGNDTPFQRKLSSCIISSAC
jgi:hypothetical protein